MKSFLLTLLLFLNLPSVYAQVKATASEINAGTDDDKFATALAIQGSKYLDQSGTKVFAVTAGTANVYTATLTPAPTGYSAGQLFYIKIATANTAASTLNINGLGAKALVKDAATPLISGDLLVNKIYAVYYDGTNFQVINAVPQAQPAISVASNKLLGRYATTTGAPQDITLGAGISLNSSGTLYAGLESGIAGTNNKIIKITNPPGGQFKGLAVETGALKIKLPTNRAIMFAIKGTIQSYDATAANRSCSFLITCYAGSMNNGFSAAFTGSNAPNFTVRWYKNDPTPAIYIGELTNTWSYPTITIDEVQASHAGVTNIAVNDGWGISIDTAFTGTLMATQINTLPFSNMVQPLTGYTVGTNTAITATDNILGAFGKVQGQLNTTGVNLAQTANKILAAPLAATGIPTFRALGKADTRPIFGAESTAGVLDWNDVTNTQPGFSPTLLLGTATNGFGSVAYYHAFNVEYGGAKLGTGNLTQMAYPYNFGTNDGIQYRTRYSSVYTPWRKIWDSINFTNLNQLTTRSFTDLQNKPTTLVGYGITDAATQASVIFNDAAAVHKTGNETIAGIKLFSNNVGIGVLDTKGYKLAVGGSVIAESVKVKLQGAWPDYVFEKGHQLLPLNELEKFIAHNKHLPDVPTADEVKKEGIELGEMNAKLLRKIEELTLYVIDLKKENEVLKERMDKLEKK